MQWKRGNETKYQKTPENRNLNVEKHLKITLNNLSHRYDVVEELHSEPPM